MKKILLLLTGIVTLAGCNQDTVESLKGDLVDTINHVIEDKEAPEREEEPKDKPDQSDDTNENDNTDENKDNETNPDDEKDSSTDDEQSKEEPKDQEDQSIVVSNPHAIDVILNKTYRLPNNFVPQGLVEPNVPHNAKEGAAKRLMRKEAAKALEELFAAAKEAGYDLVAQSGYRSIQTQTWLYNHYVETNGQEWADKFSAVPGHSEHHTGLTMDITAAVVGMSLTQEFGNTAPGEWVAKNAHKYGFVIRYPKGKSHITGYSYEPWHLRYFGVELATKIYQSGLTVEEYFGLVE
ncbi:D-alanyl-D-alanine carboxypeptidase family protein [Filobacillus milosensis]|nr:D-alanyl-D-alanine carboxypeptidase family protein [Filobacillus milosensis]